MCLSARAASGAALLLCSSPHLIFVYPTPLESIKGVTAVGSLFAASLFGPRFAVMFSALIVLSIMSTVSAIDAIRPRIHHAVAKSRAFFPATAGVHPGRHTRLRNCQPGAARHTHDADALRGPRLGRGAAMHEGCYFGGFA